jgi:acetyl esterase/lipase
MVLWKISSAIKWSKQVIQSTVFYAILILWQLPGLVLAYWTGPERPNRSLALDLFIRFFRATSKNPRMNVHRARGFFQMLHRLGEKRVKKLMANYVVEEVSWMSSLPNVESQCFHCSEHVHHRECSHQLGARSFLSENDNFAPLQCEKDHTEENREPHFESTEELDSIAFPCHYHGTGLNANDHSRIWSTSADWIYPRYDQYDTDRIILFLHGGAYMFSSKKAYHRNVVPLVQLLQRRVFLLEYRLSPENPFPAALYDAVSAYLYLVQHCGIHPQCITFMGDSAGGNLAASTLNFLRDHQLSLPGSVVLLSPWTDLAHELPSYTDNAQYDYISLCSDHPELNPVALFMGASDYSSFVSSCSYISPFLGYLDSAILHISDSPEMTLSDIQTAASCLPPIYICTGQDEILLDENILFAVLAAKAGARVVHDIFEHQVHVFPFISPNSIDTARCLGRIAEFLLEIDSHSDTENQNDVGAVSCFLWKNGVRVRGKLDIWTQRWNLIQTVKPYITWKPLLVHGEPSQ